MDEYRPVPYQEIFSKLSEDVQRKIEEGAKHLMAEEAFWNSLPEAERNKRLEKPKAVYDADSDTLWLKNGRPMPRSCEIVKGCVTAFFEAEIWYPSAVRIAGAYKLLGEFFFPSLCPPSGSLNIRHGNNGAIERTLKLAGMKASHEILSDYLWIGNGEEAWDGSEIAEDLIVSYAEDSKIPVGVGLFKAAHIITPVMASARAVKPARLV